MSATLRTLLLCYLLGTTTGSTGSAVKTPCKSPQYLVLGSSSVVNCHFKATFISIHWYDSPNYFDFKPFISSHITSPEGPGYASGEFDIQDDGSLVIKNVSLEHEKVFTVLVVTSNEDYPESYSVSVNVIALPFETCPIIKTCNCSDICYITDVEGLTCKVTASRPAISLSWTRKTKDKEIDLDYTTAIINETVTFSTFISTNDRSVYSLLLELLVCKATYSLGLLKENESVALLHNSHIEGIPTQYFKKYIERGTVVALPCESTQPIHLFVWQRDLPNYNKTLAYGTLSPEEISIHVVSASHEVDEDGSLIISNVGISHEGMYMCSYSSGDTSGIVAYNITVYVRPLVAYPMVEGCSNDRYCILPVNPSGNLTCSIRGIRPEVNITISLLKGTSDKDIHLYNHTVKIEQYDGKSDMRLTIQYDINTWSQRRILLQCRGIPDDPHLFPELSTTVELLGISDFTTEEEQPSKENKSNVIIGISIAGVVCLVLVTVMILRRIYVRRQTQSDSLRTEEEGEPMIPVTNNPPDTISGRDDPDGSATSKESLSKQPVKSKIPDEVDQWIFDNPMLEEVFSIEPLQRLILHSAESDFKFTTVGSLTRFMEFSMQCLYHSSKGECSFLDEEIFSPVMSEISKLAFEIINDDDEKRMWSTNELQNLIGNRILCHMLHAEILHKMKVNLGSCTSDNSVKNITFSHTVICQWFASCYVVNVIRNSATYEQTLVNYLDTIPFQSFPYLYRFACGKYSNVSDYILRNKGCFDCCQPFRLLCLLEDTSDPEGNNKLLTEYFANLQWFSRRLRDPEEYYNLQLMKIANARKISIERLELRESYCHTDDSTEELVLTSKIRLPKLDTVVELLIGHEWKKSETEEFLRLLRVLVNWSKLITIRFHSRVILCPPRDLKKILHLRKGKKMLWFSEFGCFSLNTNTGLWEDENEDDTACKRDVLIERLRERYKVQYNSLKPIPYIEETYHVNALFVDVGAEENSEGNAWKKLESSLHLFSKSHANKKLYILKGDPGYGKSTLGIKYSYEWCKGQSEDILIFLRLRQLVNVHSIFRTIKLCLLPDENRITTEDIKHLVLDDKYTVKVVLDGYDEYPDKENKLEDDIHRIIRKELLQDTDVVLTTRYLPDEYPDSQTQLFRLIGFDHKAQEQYVRQAFNEETKENVLSTLESIQLNTIVGDFCQIPLFFAMIVYMTKENNEFQNCKSITELFKYMLKCINDHTSNKNVSTYQAKYVAQHDELSKVAFEGLSGYNPQLQWNKLRMLELLGPKQYNHMIATGILIEEEVQDFANDDSNKKLQTIVCFYHKIFCEWFASFYFANVASKGSIILRNSITNVDPFDLQYLYRFACGQKPEHGVSIIEHLMEQYDCLKIYALVTLCILECRRKSVRIPKKILKKLCEEVISLRETEPKLHRRASIELLELASENEITISSVDVTESFHRATEEHIMLRYVREEDGYNKLSVLKTAKKLRFLAKKGRDFTKADIEGILLYASMCESLTKVVFVNGIPKDCKEVHIPKKLKNKKSKVLDQVNLSIVDLPTGKWKAIKDDLRATEEICKETVGFYESEEEKHDDTCKLLEFASKNKLPIFRVFLNETFQSVDENGIVVSSGLHLPEMASLREFRMIKRRTLFNEEDFVGILKRFRDSKSLEKISFLGCMFPCHIPIQSIPRKLTEGSVTVWLHPTELRKTSYKYNFVSGYWTVASTKKLTKKTSSAQVSEGDLTEERYRQQVEDYKKYWSEADCDRPWNGFD